MIDLNNADFENDWKRVATRPMHYFTHYLNKNKMNFIGYIERFEQDFKRLLIQIKFNEIINYENENVSNDINLECNPYKMKDSDYKYLSIHTKKTIDIINCLYSKDFEYFCYEKKKY